MILYYTILKDFLSDVREKSIFIGEVAMHQVIHNNIIIITLS